MTRRELFVRRAPFAFVAIAGQLSAIWPPGPTNMGLFWASSVLLLASVVSGAPEPRSAAAHLAGPLGPLHRVGVAPACSPRAVSTAVLACCCWYRSSAWRCTEKRGSPPSLWSAAVIAILVVLACLGPAPCRRDTSSALPLGLAGRHADHRDPHACATGSSSRTNAPCGSWVRRRT